MSRIETLIYQAFVREPQRRSRWKEDGIVLDKQRLEVLVGEAIYKFLTAGCLSVTFLRIEVPPYSTASFLGYR